MPGVTTAAMRIMLLYRALTVGGTERQIVALATGLAKRGNAVTVVTFYDDNPLGEGLNRAGVELVSLGKRGRWEIVGFVARFLSEVRRLRPEILYSFLPMTNLVALAARLVSPRLPLVWGVRTAFLVLDNYDRLTRLSYRAEAWLARWADLVVANSYAGGDDLARRGYPGDRLRIVPNGIDTERFSPDPASGRRVRAEWGIDQGTVLVGTVARLKPEKGIPLFLEAAALVVLRDERVRFVVVGGGDAEYRATLEAQGERLGIASRLLWAGARDDMPAVYNALDLLVLSSPNEGTSNAVLEAMACGISVVATDVGDNARSISTWGRVAAPGDPALLANAISLQLERRAADGTALGAGCRQHILDNYSMAAMVEKTEALLQELVGPTDTRS